MSSPGRKKKTKLQKIAELESRVKALKEENHDLRAGKDPFHKSGSALSAKFAAEDASETNNSSYSEWTESPSLASSIGGGGTVNGDTDKLKEALRALKRVTVKQEMTLATFRQKAKQRRTELEHKDKIIQRLQEENEAFSRVHEIFTQSKKGGRDDVDSLRACVADLELKLAREVSSKEEQSKMLKESQAGISNLKTQLSSMRERGVDRNKSFGSVSVLSESSGGEDYSKMKRELAKKSELVANLQYELEVAKDEIHDLKQRSQFNASFPQTPAQGNDDDFFESDDDNFWG